MILDVTPRISDGYRKELRLELTKKKFIKNYTLYLYEMHITFSKYKFLKCTMWKVVKLSSHA